MHLLAHLGICTNQNDRFPDPFIYFEQQVKFLPFHIPKPFQTEPPCIGHYRKFSPPPGNGGWSVNCARVHVGYELAIIISYPTSASFIKNTHKVSKILPPFICKTNNFQLVVNFEQTHTVTIFGEHGIMAYILLWLSQSELQNCIIQWFSF